MSMSFPARAPAFAIAMVFALGAALSGCVSTPRHSLTADVAASLKIVETRVGFAPDARLLWPDLELETGASAPVVDPSSNPEIKPAASRPAPSAPAAQPGGTVRNAVAQRLTAYLQGEAASRSGGQRPVRVIITVSDVNLPSVIQRVVLGGTLSVTASARVVDLKSGATLASYPSSQGISTAGQGLLGVVVVRSLGGQTGLFDVVARSWTSGFAGWLWVS
jgi:hypothetical protein